MENSPFEKDVRPWGRYEVLHVGSDFKVKRIEVNPAARFSLQKHSKRAETWVIVAGEGKATVRDNDTPVRRGSVIEVALGEVHRMHNTGKTPLVMIEVQFGDYLGEDDIERLSDDYARS